MHRYCGACASPLEERSVEGRIRPVCPACGRIVYLDPKVAACCIPESTGRVLLVRRAIEPGLGRWTFPGGFVDLGETVPHAAVRETREETGVQVELGPLLGVYSYEGRPTVVVVYAGTVVAGQARANAESLEVRYFAFADIPWDELAFPSSTDALRDFLQIFGSSWKGERPRREPGAL